MSRRRWLALAIGGAAVAGIAGGSVWLANQMNDSIPRFTYEVVNTFPHDTDAFTQGLVIDDGNLFEGTGGLDGASDLRQVELQTGNVLQRTPPLQNNEFGEGITVWNDVIIQLTWQNGKAFIYDKSDLRRRNELQYLGVGWGLTHDGRQWIMSDGSDKLRFYAPNFTGRPQFLPVTWDGQPVGQLNELEFIDGEIYANVWHRDFILRISPQTGRVTAWLDLSGLRPRTTWNNAEHVLNGIAYDPNGDRLFVTGKCWPNLFEIRQVPA